MEDIRLLKGSSERINIRDFAMSWDETVIPGLHKYDDLKNEVAVLTQEMDIPLDTVTELSEVCSSRTLRSHEDPSESFLLTTIPEDCNFACVRFQKHDLEKRKKDRTYNLFVNRRTRYKKADENRLLNSTKEGEQEKVDEEHQILCDVILDVSVYCPYKPQCYERKLGHSMTIVNQRFLVLGSQSLCELRDKISCINDLAVSGDFSEDPDREPLYFAKTVHRSAFFYIEGVFYNDMRSFGVKDYSQVVRDWAKEEGRGIGELSTNKMEGTTFMDLNVRLGQPYVFCHQGDCEHMIIFNDIRLSCQSDNQDRRDYPRLIHKHHGHRYVCGVCNVFSARWLVYESQFLPHDPALCCDSCFKSLHYHKDGTKIGKFKAYKYFGNAAMSLS